LPSFQGKGAEIIKGGLPVLNISKVSNSFSSDSSQRMPQHMAPKIVLVVGKLLKGLSGLKTKALSIEKTAELLLYVAIICKYALHGSFLS